MNIFRLLDNPTFYRMMRPIIIASYKLRARRFASEKYMADFGRPLNWNHPEEFNEKLRWLQFNSDTSMWTLLADKYRVRLYLEEKGMGHLLPELYGVWKRAEDIDFGSLPESFVMKGNNGSADVAIVKEKSKISIDELRGMFGRSLLNVYGALAAEMHYWDIPPRIIAEELLPNDTEGSTTLVDYKFHCFDGVPRVCKVYYNRDFSTRSAEQAFFDMDFVEHPEWGDSRKVHPVKAEITCPAQWEEMKNVAAQLSKGFPFVRVDLYVSRNRVWFGEFTFSPAAFSGAGFNHDFLSDEMGKWLRIDK